MEKIIKVHVEKLPEGVYLATLDELQGLVAQGRTITETLEIARDVARKLLESRADLYGAVDQKETEQSFDYPLIIAM